MRCTWLIRLVFCWIACAPASVRAQTSFVMLLEPAITRADYDQIVHVLSLNPAQRKSADALFEGYLAAHTREADHLKDLYDKRANAVKSKSDDAPARRIDLEAGMAEYWKKKQLGEHQIMSDLRSVLTAEQIATVWPSGERLQRRKWLRYVDPGAATQWYRVDLVRCAADAKLEPASREAIAPKLLEYELALEAQLVRYGQLNWSKTGDLLAPSDEDVTRVARDVGVATAALNHKYARALAEPLPPHESTKLTRTVHQQAYWWLTQLFTREQATALARCESLPDLSDLQRERIATIHSRWSTDTERFRRWAEEQFDLLDAEFERTNTEKLVEKAHSSPPGKDPFSLVWDPMMNRYVELETKLVEDLRAALTPDQRDAVWPTAKDR